jgi:SSS family solute:Na+ symporter
VTSPLATGVLVAYLLTTILIGVIAARRSSGSVDDFVAAERGFGPVVMYFVVGATIFSAYALLGTPQRVVAKGSDVLYVFAYGAIGLLPMFFLASKVRRIAAREGYVTHAELVAGRFASPRIARWMGIAAIVAFVPYLLIQFKAAGIVMQVATGIPRLAGAAVVYAVVVTYVLTGGVRGVGWTNVLQGIVMLVVVWSLGLAIPIAVYGGVPALFDQMIARHPEFLTLPGPAPGTSHARYTSEVVVSALGLSMWPHVFMKLFTARSARLSRQSVVAYPSFLLFLVPLVFLGYIAVLEGGPSDDGVLFWLTGLPRELATRGGLAGPSWLAASLVWASEHGVLLAAVTFAVLAASMSTGDALLHAGGAVLVRDVIMLGFGRPLDPDTQQRLMRAAIVGLAVVAWVALAAVESTSVVDLLLLAYAVPIQFLPLTLVGLLWPRANRVGAELGLVAGVSTALAAFVLSIWAPSYYAAANPWGIEIGVIGFAVNVLGFVLGSLLTPADDADLLARFEL